MQLLLIGLFIAVAGALAFLVSTGLGRRFKALTATMDRLREGEFKVDVPFTEDGHETGKIAGTLQVTASPRGWRTTHAGSKNLNLAPRA